MEDQEEMIAADTLTNADNLLTTAPCQHPEVGALTTLTTPYRGVSVSAAIRRRVDDSKVLRHSSGVSSRGVATMPASLSVRALTRRLSE
jgi:hypothetical protein